MADKLTETVERLRGLLAKQGWAKDWPHNIVPSGKPAHELACEAVRALPMLLAALTPAGEDEVERAIKRAIRDRLRDDPSEYNKGFDNGLMAAETVALSALAALPRPNVDEMREAVDQLCQRPSVSWAGTEEEAHDASIKACRARRKLWGNDGCDERDGSCSECHSDMAATLETPESMRARIRFYEAQIDRFLQSPPLIAALNGSGNHG